ncbi:hypothetical protein B0H13DRAFT_2313113 [Mycena leptocephala]|nr:hypothetical protein B0H13DRAFT_2313113 [Mycena leptocephala]
MPTEAFYILVGMKETIGRMRLLASCLISPSSAILSSQNDMLFTLDADAAVLVERWFIFTMNHLVPDLSLYLAPHGRR